MEELIFEGIFESLALFYFLTWLILLHVPYHSIAIQIQQLTIFLQKDVKVSNQEDADGINDATKKEESNQSIDE